MGVCRGILGRGLLFPRLVPRGIRGRATGRIRAGRGMVTGRLLLPGRIPTRTMMIRPGVVALVHIVVVRPGPVMVLFGVGMMPTRRMFVRVAG